MVNLNKESIKKIKDIDKKADAILSKAEQNSEEIISNVRHELPGMIKEAQIVREEKKVTKIESAKKDISEKTQKEIETGISKIKSKDEKYGKNIDAASDIALDIFLKKIDFLKE